jgi:arylsulfatase A-like enzyme
MTILLAIAFGLCAGYLDVGILIFKKFCWNSEGHFRTAHDFPWTVAVGHVVLMLVPGAAVAALNRFGPIRISLRRASWLFASLALWLALLRMPLYGWCSLLLAAGLGRVIGDAVAEHRWRPRQTRAIFATLIGTLALFAVLSSGWHAAREYCTVIGLPPAPPRARNVVLIVWDTVRAYNLGLYGYPRTTTPNLRRWAEKGVTYERALAPAPWTFPSHASFFTGQWPIKLNSQWKFVLDTPSETLAEYLTSHGYQTAGFVANTNCCTYETGLSRGFAHFDDYALTPRSLLSRTVAGNWILKNIVSRRDYYDQKWIGLQSRGAAGINDAFWRWMSRRRPDRPFFAFLNFFDAHDPYIPPQGYESRFGIPPKTPEDYQFLIDIVRVDKLQRPVRDFVMARDCYDDCIAFLDQKLGDLLDALENRGILENTDVIITSDHGEAFGMHATFGHSYTVTLEEVGVPLVILSPAAPAGRVVDSPVSLRDLPATVVDLIGLSASSPFPGRSLAAYWKLPPAMLPPSVTSPAFSEQANEIAFQDQPGHGREHPGFQMSLVASGHHYIRNGLGAEQLYDLETDPLEQMDLMETASGKETVADFRKALLDVLTDNAGSVEVEKAYLATYRQWLEELVRPRDSQPLALGD